MKVAPVSADLLIKLALGAAVVGFAVYGLRRVSGAAGEVFSEAGAAISDAVTFVGETADNVVSTPVYAIGDAVGLPRTAKNECQECINEYRAAPWWKQAYLSFNVSAKCSTADYLRFVSTQRGPLE